MKFKSGDQVRFLNDIGGGVVRSVDPDGIVLVQTQDGFEIPVSSKELIPAGTFIEEEHVEPQVARPVKEDKAMESRHDVPHEKEGLKLPANISPDTAVNILIGFIPEDQGPVFSSKLACYLINDSPYFAYYSIGSWERGNYYHLSSGMIESQTKNLLSVFSHTAISKISGLHVQMIWLSQGRYKRKLPLDELVDIQLVNFSKESYYHENMFFDERAIVFPVTPGEPAARSSNETEVTDSVWAMKPDDKPVQQNPAGKKEKNPDTMEIDLHMDEHEMKKSQFSLSGILALQMSRFHSALEEAISKKLRRLVIIHGVGQGTLKMQIRKELQEKYPEFLFQDASFREYGFGATMVHLVSVKKQ